MIAKQLADIVIFHPEANIA